MSVGRVGFSAVEISVGGFVALKEEVMRLGRERCSSYVCFANAHMVAEAAKDDSFAGVVRGATMVMADGSPLAWFVGRAYGLVQERVAGMDLFPVLIREAAEQQIPVFFYGEEPDLLASLLTKLAQEWPLLRVAGVLSPPFRELSREEKESHVTLINESGAGLVFVALGCPKQEKWMAENSQAIRACLLGVGNAFRVWEGSATRAPMWCRELGLEWLWRMAAEPGRLWKRYLKGNSRFLWEAIRFCVAGPKRWIKRGES